MEQKTQVFDVYERLCFNVQLCYKEAKICLVQTVLKEKKCQDFIANVSVL